MTAGSCLNSTFRLGGHAEVVPDLGAPVPCEPALFSRSERMLGRAYPPSTYRWAPNVRKPKRAFRPSASTGRGRLSKKVSEATDVGKHADTVSKIGLVEPCARHDSNMRPLPPQGSALSPELRALREGPV